MSDISIAREKRPLKPRPQLNSRLLPGLVGLLLLLQLVDPYKGWMILLVGLGGGWLFSFLWARSLADGLRLTREMRFGWAQVGDRLEERFTLRNEGWAPGLWVELVDHSSLPDYHASRVTSVGTQTANQWRLKSVCTRRGLFTLGPTSLRTGDPLGVYTVRLHYDDSTALMVTPPVLPLPAIEIAPGERAGEGHRLRQDPHERTVSSSNVRDYQPGDDMRWVHWRLSAHRDDFFVRIFDSAPSSDWWVFLDLDQRAQAGQGWDSTEEHGVMLAASLTDRGLRPAKRPGGMGRAVGLVVHGQELVWLPPQAGDGQRLKILRALALVTPGPCSLAELLERARPALGKRPSLIVITPAVEGGWFESLLPLLRRGVAPTVLLLDPVSFGDDSAARAPALSRTLALLSDWGVAHYTVTRDLLDRPEARPGRRGRWEWRILGTGRAIAVQRPRDMGWRGLS
jgi:uncharacterized protein (DUF58 family)